jgi:hypothetical protein
MPRLTRSDHTDIQKHHWSSDFFFHDYLTDQSDSHPEYGPVRKNTNLLFRSPTREVLIDNADSFTHYNREWQPDETPIPAEVILWRSQILEPLRKLGLRLQDVAPSRRRLNEIKAVSDQEIRQLLLPLLGADSAPHIEQVILRHAYYVEHMTRYARP